MSRFIKDRFNFDGMYLKYDGTFVARFKRASDKTSFVSFLSKNFSVEEYFTALSTSHPLPVLESKGYILPHIRKWLREAGLPVDRDGYNQLIARSFK
jgi:hypothetical protein